MLNCLSSHSNLNPSVLGIQQKINKMASAIQEITELMSRVLAIPSDSNDALPGQTSWRADSLKQALTAAEKAWLDGSHDSLALLAEKVADAARDRELLPTFSCEHLIRG